MLETLYFFLYQNDLGHNEMRYTLFYCSLYLICKGKQPCADLGRGELDWNAPPPPLKIQDSLVLPHHQTPNYLSKNPPPPPGKRLGPRMILYLAKCKSKTFNFVKQ